MQFRKLLCVIVVFFGLGLYLVSFVTGNDIPQGAVTILSFVIPCIIAGYYASSAYEHCYEPKKPEPKSEDHYD